MLNWNGKNTKLLSWGDKTIQRAYLGDKLVFENAPTYAVNVMIDPAGSGTVTGAGQYKKGTQVAVKANPADGYKFVAWKEAGDSRLPNGYTELEYIQSSGTQYINTGFNPTTQTKTVLDIKISSTSGNFVVFGAKVDTADREKQYFVMAMGASARFEANYFSFTEANLVNLADYNERGVLSLDGSALGFNNSTAALSYTAGDNEVPYPIYLFGYDLSGTLSSAASMALYACQIYESGSLVRDFVPCSDPSGAIGLYDLVEGMFYANAGTGTFVAGPEVSSDVTVSEDSEYTFTVIGDRTLVAVFSVSSRLPEGYTEVEYISNPNLGYAESVPNVKNPLYGTRFEFDVEIKDIPTAQSYLWGKIYSYSYSSYKRNDTAALCVPANTSAIRCFCSYSSTSYSYGYVQVPFAENRLHIIVDSPKGTLEVNGQTAAIATRSSSYWLSDPPELFAIRYYSYSTRISGYQPLNYNFYSLKIYSSTADATGDLLYEYVPCIDPNGDVGIYELVNTVFTKSADETKPFVAGPAV